MKNTFFYVFAVFISLFGASLSHAESWSVSYPDTKRGKKENRGTSVSLGVAADVNDYSAPGGGTGYRATGYAWAEARILKSKPTRVVEGLTRLSAENGEVTLDASIKFAGRTIWHSPASTSPNHDRALPQFHKEYKFKKIPPFRLGPVDIKVKPFASVSLSSNLSATYRSSDNAAAVLLEPAIFETAGGVEVGTFEGIVKIKGRLTLCGLSPTLEGHLDFDEDDCSYARGYLGLRTLDGKIFLKVKSDFWDIDNKYDLVDWNGFQREFDFYSESFGPCVDEGPDPDTGGGDGGVGGENPF